MRLLTVVLTLFTFTAVASPSAWAFGKKQATPVTDDSIHDQVQRKLADDAFVKGGGLDVEVHNGTVTLKGRVADSKAKSKAEKLAKKVHGVTSVDNQLVVSSETNPQN